MTLISKSTMLTLCAVTLCTGILLSGQAVLLSGRAHAQSTQHMDMLTAEERKEFSRRLQYSAASSERAKITAEMNRLVRERTLAKRNAERDAGKNSNSGN